MQTTSTLSLCGFKTSPHRLEDIHENGTPTNWLALTCDQPDTPTESMEFLARSWSLSALELSKALSNASVTSNNAEKPICNSVGSEVNASISTDSKDPELYLLHQVLNPELLSNQQLLRNGQLYRSLLRGKTAGKWLKDPKERKKQEIRTHNAQLHAAVSVAGVAAAVAAITASTATPKTPVSTQKMTSKTSAAVASAAALVASHCIEIAEGMGAERDHIITAINSAMNAKTNGDIMTLTAGAATALRGAATLRARLQNGLGVANSFDLVQKCEEGKDTHILIALDFVTRGQVLLKRTRKGALHWKQVSFNINSSWQVVAKMKSRHIGGTFTKKKKCVVSGFFSDISAWPGRGTEDGNGERDYFGIKTGDRVIEFECGSKREKQMWIEGLHHMLNCHAKVKIKT